MMQRSCAVCSKPFDAFRPHAKYCGKTCGKRAQRAGLASSRGATVTPISAAPRIEGASDLVDAVRKTIEVAGRVNSVEGQLAIVLAEKMVGYDTGGGMAAVSRELSRVMSAVLRDEKAGDDFLDELKRRRDMKRSRS
jgi:hypothetical protein